MGYTVTGGTFDGTAAGFSNSGYYSSSYPYVYGTCTTSASTPEKAVTMGGFSSYAMIGNTIPPGTHIFVKFTYSNTSTAPTLNVNSSGPYGIMITYTSSSSNTRPGNTPYASWSPGEVVEFIFTNDSVWQMVSPRGTANIPASSIDFSETTSGYVPTATGTWPSRTALTFSPGTMSVSGEILTLEAPTLKNGSTNYTTIYSMTGAGTAPTWGTKRNYVYD